MFNAALRQHSAVLRKSLAMTAGNRNFALQKVLTGKSDHILSFMCLDMVQGLKHFEKL